MLDDIYPIVSFIPSSSHERSEAAQVSSTGAAAANPHATNPRRSASRRTAPAMPGTAAMSEETQFIALFEQPCDGPGQSIACVGLGLQRVVKGDDRPVAGIAADLGKDLFASQVAAVVACHQIPHDDAVFVTQGTVLPECQMPVRWAEKV